MFSRLARQASFQSLRRRVPGSLPSPAAVHAQAATKNGFENHSLLLGAAGAGLLAAVVVYDERRKPAPALCISAYQIPIGEESPKVVNCFIEVARESRMKYEFDDELSLLKLDRVLHSAVFYPHDYGFIPQTLCGDGDPLDVLVLGTSALQPGSIVDVVPVAYMLMEDEKGLDEKVLAVPLKDPRFAEIRSLRDVPEHYLREISHFFETYKALEREKWVKVSGWRGTSDTHLLIEQTHAKFLEKEKQKLAKKNGGKTLANAAADKSLAPEAQDTQ